MLQVRRQGSSRTAFAIRVQLSSLRVIEMPSIQKNNRAAALLAELRDDDRLSIERLALLVGVTAEELRACRDHVAVLPPVQQAKLGRAVAVRVPRLAKLARRLEEQATAAARVQSGATIVHLIAPPKW